jgi:hypothetical protein
MRRDAYEIIVYNECNANGDDNQDIMAFFLFLPIVGVGVRWTGDGERCDCKIILDPLEG